MKRYNKPLMSILNINVENNILTSSPGNVGIGGGTINGKNGGALAPGYYYLFDDDDED